MTYVKVASSILRYLLFSDKKKKKQVLLQLSELGTR